MKIEITNAEGATVVSSELIERLIKDENDDLYLEFKYIAPFSKPINFTVNADNLNNRKYNLSSNQKLETLIVKAEHATNTKNHMHISYAASRGNFDFYHHRKAYLKAARALLADVETDLENYHYKQGFTTPGWHMVRNSNDRTSELHYVADGFSTTDDAVYVGRKGNTFVQAGDAGKQLAALKEVLIANPNVRKHLGFAAAGFMRGLIPGLDMNPVWIVKSSGIGTGRTVLANWIESMMHKPEQRFGEATVAAAHSHTRLCTHSPVVMDIYGVAIARTANPEQFIYNLAQVEGRSRLVLDKQTGKYESVTENNAYYTVQILVERCIELSGGMARRTKVFEYDFENPLWTSLSVPDTENYGWLAPMLIADIQKNLVAYQDFFQSVRKLVSTDGDALAILGELMLSKVLDIKLEN